MGTGSRGSSRASGAVLGKTSVEVEVSWKMFKRQHSIVVKSTEY